MRLHNRILLFAVLLLAPVMYAQSQQYSTEGTEFYVSYLIDQNSSPACEVTFSSPINTTVTIANASKSYTESFAITGGMPHTVKVAKDKCVHYINNTVESGALHITSASPITVYSMNYVAYVADGALVYPRTACGSEYYTASYRGVSPGLPSKFVAIAFEDNTQLKITPAVKTRGGRVAGVAYTITLNKGQTYMEKAFDTLDFTGTYIEEVNGKKFAFFSGTECVNIPTTMCPFCDVLMEQMLPVTALGKKYLLAPLATQSMTPVYTYRVIAPFGNTKLKINGVLAGTLQKGNVLTRHNQSGPVSLEADRPIMVIQYMQGAVCTGVGDPAMVVIPSVEQFIDRVSYATATYNGFDAHYAYILLKTSSIGLLKINGIALPAADFKPFAAMPEYSYTNVPLPGGYHLLECGQGFSMIAYGYGQHISYAYIGGSSFKNLSHSIAISPPLCGSLNFTMKNDGDTTAIIKSYWHFGDSTIDSGTYITKTYTKHGTYKVANIVLSTVKTEPDTVYSVLTTLPNPLAGFRANDTAQCLAGNFFLCEDTSVFISGSAKKTTRWLFSDNANAIIDSVQISRRYTDTGIFTVKLVAQSKDGCIDTKEQKLYVYPVPQVNVVFTDTALCYKNHGFAIQNNTTIGSGTVQKSEWFFSDGDTSTLFSPPAKKFAQPGSYYAKGIMTSNMGCVDSVTRQFTVYPTVTPAFKVADVCLGDTCDFINTTVDTGRQVIYWHWATGNGDTAGTLHHRYVYTDTGFYTVSLGAVTLNGCADTLVRSNAVRIKPTPNAYFMPEAKDSSGFYFTLLLNNLSQGAQQYLWDFGNGSQSTEESPTYSYTKSGSYMIRLAATNALGCADVHDTLLVVQLPVELYIPNAFTPGNGDALNNVFMVTGASDVKRFKMMIFDRWGELLFVCDDIKKGWDGTFKHTPMPDGAYIYIINIIAHEKVLNYRGTLTLLR